jgi:hypothetical protein
MEKRFVVKNFVNGKYFQGYDFAFEGKTEWDTESPFMFSNIELAENFIKEECGQFVIETIYIS